MESLKGVSNEKLVLLYQNGVKEALETLLEENKGIVYKIAKHYNTQNTSSIDEEDLIQEGMMGLIIAAEKYSVSREYVAKFITYAVYWIKSKISRFIKSKNTNEEVSLNVPIKEGENDEKINFIPIDECGFEKLEDRIYLKSLRIELEELMKNELTLKQREVIKLRYGWDCKDMTLENIAEVYSISRERIRQIEIQSLNKLRDSKWGRAYEKKYISVKKYNNYNTLINEIDRKAHLEKFDKLNDLFGDCINDIYG